MSAGVDASSRLRLVGVVRETLVARLEDASHGRLTQLIAPAGFGKSLLLAQWRMAYPERNVAWMQLESPHADALQFGRLLVDALRVRVPSLGQDALERLETTGITMGPAFLRGLLEDLAATPDCVLVIEDLHAIENAELLAELSALVAQVPPQLHFVVSSRTSGLPDVHRLRTRGDVTDLGPDDLAFDRETALRVVEEVGNVTLDESQLATLLARTEGWPAGVQLAALALRWRSDVDEVLAGFTGDEPFVAEYLGKEVLAGQDDTVRRFLTRTSVLDRLTARLCDAVTGEPNGQRMLDAVEARGLFLRREDSRGRWFRYHALFRDVLRSTLRADEPDLEPVLLRRAANWHLAEGQLAPAIEYLIAARAWDEVTDLVLRHGRELWERGEATTAARWLETVPAAVRSSRPAVRLATATLVGFAGRCAAAAQIVDEVHASSVATPGDRLYADMLRALLAQYPIPPARIIESADRVLAGLATPVAREMPDVLGLGLPARAELAALASKGRALFYEGATDAAREVLGAAITSAGMSFPVYAVHALGSLALLEATSGSLVVGRTLASESLAIAREADLIAHPAVADALLAMGRVHGEQGEYMRAIDVLGEAEERSAQNRRSVLLAICGVEAALVHLAAGQPSAALRALERDLGDLRLPAGIAQRRTAIEAEICMVMDEPDRARRLLGPLGGGVAYELRAAAVRLALAGGDVALARSLLAQWPDDGGVGSRLARLIWDAALAAREGDARRARERVQDALVLGEPDDHVRLFRVASPDVLRLLRERSRTRWSAYLRKLTEPAEHARPAARGELRLAQELTPRELLVLRLLGSRLSNTELAARLYISSNTLKTHLRHIYQKLGVTSRVGAVMAAQSRQLI